MSDRQRAQSASPYTSELFEFARINHHRELSLRGQAVLQGTRWFFSFVVDVDTLWIIGAR